MAVKTRTILSQLYLMLLLLNLILTPISGYKLPQRSRKRDIPLHAEVQKQCAKNNVPSYYESKRKASSIAIKAALEAKAASDAQMEAAENAAQLVKAQLADKAIAAAKAANAALAGKQQIVEQLDREVRESELAVSDEAACLQGAQGNCDAATQAAKQAGLQLKALTSAVGYAQSNVQNSEKSSIGAQQEVAVKQQLVEAAKKRVEMLLRELDNAQTDYRATKKAADRACAAAREAKMQATRARRKAEVLCKLRRRNSKH